MPDARGGSDPEPHPPETAGVQDAGFELSAVGVRGDFIDRLIYVTDSSVSLINSVGYLDGDKPILVPFADVRLSSAPPEGHARGEIFSELMTLDNLASLLAALCTDFRAACAELCTIAQGSLAVEATRLQRLKDLTSEMNGQIERCMADLDGRETHDVSV